MKRALAWVLWSPRNAGITVAGLVAVVAAMVVAATVGGSTGTAPAGAAPKSSTTATPDGPTPVPRPTPTATPTTVAPSATPPAGEQDEATVSTADTAKARQAADRFTAAWLAGRTTGHTKWVESLRPLAAPELLPFLAATPAAAIPKATVQDMTAPDMGADVATVSVTLTDGTRFDLTVMVSGGRWVASAMEPR